MKSFYFLSGLPRSGSTLLSCILDQNPNIHAEGNSGVCQLMWDTQASAMNNQQLKANRRFFTGIDIVKSIPEIYYKDVTKNIVVDKCRSWTLPDNMRLIESYITTTPKVIVTIRKCSEVIASYIEIMQANGHSDDMEKMMLTPMTEPLMRSYDGVMFAKKYNEGQFLFVDYDDLVDNTKETILKIYTHCGWDSYEHDFDNIVNNHPEDDEFYSLIGMHDVHSKIVRKDMDIQLSNETLDICAKLDEEMYGDL